MKRVVVLAVLVSSALGGFAHAEDSGSQIVAECDRLAASDLDPERPASVPGLAFDHVDAKAAIPACEEAAKVAPDNRRMIFQLGRAYSAGHEYEKAFTQYKRAADLGHRGATHNLAELYYRGTANVRDLSLARELFEKAAAEGLSLSMYSLGLMYQKGDGVPPDLVKARVWHQKAAAEGLSLSMYALGLMYQKGDGVPPDLVKARVWYQKAAEAGLYRALRWLEADAANSSVESMIALASIYEEGKGTSEDKSKALEWWRKAADTGNPRAKLRLREITLDQIVKSQSGIVLGDPNGDVTIMEFFDYNEIHSRHSVRQIGQILLQDKKVRLVLLDLPVIKNESIGVSQIAIAASQQLTGEEFFRLHRELLSYPGKVDKDKAMKIVAKFGLDQKHLESYIITNATEKILHDNTEAASALEISAIPTFVIGGDTIVGEHSLGQFTRWIAAVRRCGKMFC